MPQEDPEAAVMALSRLCEDRAALETWRPARLHRRIDRTIEFMDFEHADPGKQSIFAFPWGPPEDEAFPERRPCHAAVSGMGKPFRLMPSERTWRMPAFYFNAEWGRGPA